MPQGGAPNSLPPVEELRRIFDYDPQTGHMAWRVNQRRAKAGQVAGTVHPRGERLVVIKRRCYLVHRVAWKMVYGEDPALHIDHIDCNPGNNAIANLRLATRSQNQRNRPRQSNNKSGFKGVSWDKRLSKWVARIRVGSEYKYLGGFARAEDAHAAYERAAREYYGEFARAA